MSYGDTALSHLFRCTSTKLLALHHHQLLSASDYLNNKSQMSRTCSTHIDRVHDDKEGGCILSEVRLLMLYSFLTVS